MDIEGLKLALSFSLSSNEEIRKANADIILKAREIQNFGPFLLQISADITNPFEIQQNAAIQLKNFVKKFWKFGEDMNKNKAYIYEDDENIIVIHSQDKAFIRNNIFEAFLTNDNKLIRKQYSECIKKISKFELGKDFNFIIDRVIECFNSKIDDRIFAGIQIFFTISKEFSLESGDLRKPYSEAFEKTHDYLINFVPGLLENFDQEKACQIIYCIVKIFYLSSTLKLEEILKKIDNLEKWFNILLSILEKKYFGDLVKKTEKTEEIKILSGNVYWKIKIYCLKIFNNFYAKYSFIGRNNDIKPEVSNLIKNHFAEKFFDVYLKILYLSKSEFIPDTAGGYIFRFFSDSLSNNHLMAKLNENLDTIIKDYLIQSVFLKMEDIQLWKDDVKSYLLKQFNFLEGFNSLRNNAIKFANELCKYRVTLSNGKKEKNPYYFENIYKFFASVLEIYDNHVKENVQTDFRIKEAVLTIVENISETICEHSPKTIEKFMELFVFRELMSTNPFIRIRAFMVIYSFKNFKYTTMENLTQITDSIYQSLNDDNLSIRVFACICAPSFFGNKEIKPKLEEHISKILSIYILLMNEVDLEEILISLEYIVQIFNEKIKDFVVDLTKILVDRFKKITQNDDENQNNNSPIVKEGIIKTLICIIGIFRKNETLFDQIYDSVRIIIQTGFTDEEMENFEDSLDLIITICKEGEIYGRAWEYFIPIVETIIGTQEEVETNRIKNPGSIFIGHGYECFESVINNLLLFITKDVERFLIGSPEKNEFYLEKTMQLVQNTILYGKSCQEFLNIRYAFKILTAILESAKGKTNPLFNEIFFKISGFFILQINTEEKFQKDHKNALIELCSSCFIYNSQMMIALLSENNILEKVLDFWLSKNSALLYEVNRNKSLLAIISIITIKPEEQNKTIIKHLKLLLDTMLVLLKIKFEDFEDTLEEIHSEKTNFEQDDEEKIKNDNQDENHEDILDDELEEDDEDSEWDQLEFLNELTVIEQLDPINNIREGFEFIQNNYSEYYDYLISLIRKEDLKILKNCFKKDANSSCKKNI